MYIKDFVPNLHHYGTPTKKVKIQQRVNILCKKNRMKINNHKLGLERVCNGTHYVLE